MAEIYPEPDDEERAADLEPGTAPEPVGVYDPPERSGTRGLNLTLIIIILVLLAIAYLVVQTLL